MVNFLKCWFIQNFSQWFELLELVKEYLSRRTYNDCLCMDNNSFIVSMKPKYLNQLFSNMTYGHKTVNFLNCDTKDPHSSSKITVSASPTCKACTNIQGWNGRVIDSIALSVRINPEAKRHRVSSLCRQKSCSWPRICHSLTVHGR